MASDRDLDPPPLGKRDGWKPAHDDDYCDGGAFPEIPIDQYPSGIGHKRPLVPLTFVCGFLGAGKTTVLKHVLENQEGKRVGVVVNDMAEVNIDAKLLARRQIASEDSSYEDTVELENGCACCTAGPDLMDSVLKLIRLSIRRDMAYGTHTDYSQSVSQSLVGWPMQGSLPQAQNTLHVPRADSS
jgi:hypothetical protein